MVIRTSHPQGTQKGVPTASQHLPHRTDSQVVPNGWSSGAGFQAALYL